MEAILDKEYKKIMITDNTFTPDTRAPYIEQDCHIVTQDYLVNILKTTDDYAVILYNNTIVNIVPKDIGGGI